VENEVEEVEENEDEEVKGDEMRDGVDLASVGGVGVGREEGFCSP